MIPLPVLLGCKVIVFGDEVVVVKRPAGKEDLFRLDVESDNCLYWLNGTVIGCMGWGSGKVMDWTLSIRMVPI